MAVCPLAFEQRVPSDKQLAAPGKGKTMLQAGSRLFKRSVTK